MTAGRTFLLYLVAGALALGGAAACIGGSDTDLNPQPIPPHSPEDSDQTGGSKGGEATTAPGDLPADAGANPDASDAADTEAGD